MIVISRQLFFVSVEKITISNSSSPKINEIQSVGGEFEEKQEKK